MKKFFTTCLLLMFAVAGFQAMAQAYVIGNDPLGGWNRTGGVEMTLQNGIYSVTVNNVGAGVYFAIAPDNTDDWSTVRRPSANGVAPTGEWEDTFTGTNNSWKTDVAGNYTFQYNPANQQVKVTIAGAVVADPAWYLLGAVNGWTQSDDYKFAENNGVFTLTKTLSGEFKLKDEKGNWYGNGKTFTAEDNSVELGENGDNNNLPVEAEYTLTIKDNVLTITGFSGEEPDPTMTLKGSFDEWGAGEAMALQEDGTFTLTKALEAGAEFKFVDQVGNWWGPVSEGNFEVTQEQVEQGTPLSLTSESGMNNFMIPVAGEWTFVVDPVNLTVVISGQWGVEPEKKFYIAGSFTEWADGKLEMAQAEDGSFSISIEGVVTGDQFKFIDENGNWYGGDTQSMSETFGVHPEYCTDIPLTMGDAGSNFEITEGQGNLTFTIKDGALSVTGWSKGGVKGDVDGNGLVNGSDVTTLYNVLLNGAEVSGNADVDGNGLVNGTDVTALYNILLQ